LRSRKETDAASGDRGGIDDHVEQAMCCCQIPPYHDVRPARTKPADDNGFVVKIWASFVTGIALLSLSLASAAWLASWLA
jgi:hypothetical protein